ncbi:MAG: NusG domain II-containing protein [Ruminococcus sp.]|nr:NusG domain II-containing protein [Ruminococcus sp.]
MNKKDLILIGAVLLAALLGFLFFNTDKDKGSTVVITLDGNQYGTYPISTDKTITVKSENGINTVVIKSGEVYMQDADCPDKYCVDKGHISKVNDTIICLPHKLVVEIKDTDNQPPEVDEVVK